MTWGLTLKIIGLVIVVWFVEICVYMAWQVSRQRAVIKEMEEMDKEVTK